MKRCVWVGLLLALALGLCGCSKNQEVTVVNTFAATPEELRGLLDTIRAAQEPAAKINMKEEPDEG